MSSHPYTAHADTAPTVPSASTITLRHRIYTVTAHACNRIAPYTLTGPRGAEFHLIRNVHSGHLRPSTFKSNMTLEGVVLDDQSTPGTFRVVCG